MSQLSQMSWILTVFSRLGQGYLGHVPNVPNILVSQSKSLGQMGHALDFNGFSRLGQGYLGHAPNVLDFMGFHV